MGVEVLNAIIQRGLRSSVAGKTTVAVVILLATTVALADEPTSYDASEILFARRIAPLLREKCLGCHGQDPEKIEGGIDLRNFESSTMGGDSQEPGIVPGKADESSVYLAALRGEEIFLAMPPKESEALNAKQLDWLRRWIETGAKWPSESRIEAIESELADEWSLEDGVSVKSSGGLSDEWTNRRYEPTSLWAYQPLRHVVIPGDANSAIDHMIAPSMPAGLIAAPRADRRTLIRRASFDLTGLPPTPEDVTTFLNDPAGDNAAFASLVDRLLESPHYGERMAQHWLDVTRYADSSGFANDYERGNAWRFRDYVIRSFNDDKPFDQFIREQIAGDEIMPDSSEGIIATGFLRMGPWELTGMEVAKVARMRFLDDVTNSVGETFLGQSLQCCRCHDHKFDPIPTRDYYRIQAVFATTQLAERHASFLSDENTQGFEEREALQKSESEYKQILTTLDKTLLKNAEAWYAENDRDPQAWNEAVANSQQDAGPRGVFNSARNSLLRAGVQQEDFPPVSVGFTPQQFGMERVARKGLERLKWQFDRYRPFALSVYNGYTRSMTSVNQPQRIPKDLKEGELEKTCIHTGGDPFAEGEPVLPGVLSVIEEQLPAAIPDSIQGRRTALADWIASPRNPLTPRVIVNRLWQWHFGRAIAGNPNNFGSTGKRPTHPELLDWLAGDLLRNHWSIKKLHRRIMNSETYCRSSTHPDRKLAGELDPQNESYAAFMPRRLSAEELRDSMLAVSHELNLQLGGMPCRPMINAEVARQPRQVMGTFAAAWTPNPKPNQRNRRSIYVLKLRGLIDPSLEVFNSPSPDFSCERRDTSTVTPQVFAMFNSHNTYSRALAQADNAMKQTSDPADVIRLIYRQMFSRSASDEEIQRCLSHWQRIESMLPLSAEPSEAPPREIVREAIEENTGENFTFVERQYALDDFEPDLQPSEVSLQTRALADVCLVLMNSNEFVYVY